MCRHQPNRRALGLKSLDQFPEFSELVGVGRNRTAGEVKAVGVLVDFEQFCHVKAMEDLRQGIGGFNLTVQNRWPEPITIALVQTRLCSHVVVMFLHMAEPLLSVGQALASLIDHHCCGVRQVVEKRGGLLPGEPHQPAHAFRGPAVQKLLCALRTEQLLQSIGHRLPELVRNQRPKPCWCESKRIDGVQ